MVVGARDDEATVGATNGEVVVAMRGDDQRAAVSCGKVWRGSIDGRPACYIPIYSLHRFINGRRCCAVFFRPKGERITPLPLDSAAALSHEETDGCQPTITVQDQGKRGVGELTNLTKGRGEPTESSFLPLHQLHSTFIEMFAS